MRAGPLIQQILIAGLLLPLSLGLFVKKYLKRTSFSTIIILAEAPKEKSRERPRSKIFSSNIPPFFLQIAIVSMPPVFVN